MSDIEDELLALAGGDVSDDEQDGTDMGESAAPSPPAADSGLKGTATSKAASKKAKKRAQDGDSEEEGEA